MIGNTIKRLRHEKGLTQEKLAEMLFISPQAVSRWETGAAGPDISLIAPLCNLFEVSADVLLGIDIQNKQAQIEKYSSVFSAYASAMQKSDELRAYTISQLREGVYLYPDSRELKMQLATTLYMNSESPSDMEEKREMCDLLYELIKDTDDMSEKSRHISMFCAYARFTGNEERGRELANMLPGSKYSRHLCLALCCEDDVERKRELYAYMRSSWGSLKEALFRLITDAATTSGEMKTIREKQERIYEILFDGDDIVKYEDFDEYKVAKAFYKVGDYDGAARYLKTCLDKWTRQLPIETVSPWRDEVVMVDVISKDEAKTNAEDFIKMVELNFPKISEDERIKNLLRKAENILKS